RARRGWPRARCYAAARVAHPPSRGHHPPGDRPMPRPLAPRCAIASLAAALALLVLAAAAGAAPPPTVTASAGKAAATEEPLPKIAEKVAGLTARAGLLTTYLDA